MYLLAFKSSFFAHFPPLLLAHEAAIHAAKLRVELTQSRSEQNEYLKNVELARVLEKRAERKREKGEEFVFNPINTERARKRPTPAAEGGDESRKKKKDVDGQMETVLTSIF